MHHIRIFILCAFSIELVSCGAFSGKDLMPGRNETYSYKGPGSSKVEKGKFPPIFFKTDSAFLSNVEARTLDDVTDFVTANPDARVLIVGFANDPGTDEYNRVLGEQRAQKVRAYLLEAGCPESALQTLSYGSEESHKSNDHDGRVEIGIVR